MRLTGGCEGWTCWPAGRREGLRQPARGRSEAPQSAPFTPVAYNHGGRTSLSGSPSPPPLSIDIADLALLLPTLRRRRRRGAGRRSRSVWRASRPPKATRRGCIRGRAGRCRGGRAGRRAGRKRRLRCASTRARGGFGRIRPAWGRTCRGGRLCDFPSYVFHILSLFVSVCLILCLSFAFSLCVFLSVVQSV